MQIQAQTMKFMNYSSEEIQNQAIEIQKATICDFTLCTPLKDQQDNQFLVHQKRTLRKKIKKQYRMNKKQPINFQDQNNIKRHKHHKKLIKGQPIFLDQDQRRNTYNNYDQVNQELSNFFTSTIHTQYLFKPNQGHIRLVNSLTALKPYSFKQLLNTSSCKNALNSNKIGQNIAFLSQCYRDEDQISVLVKNNQKNMLLKYKVKNQKNQENLNDFDSNNLDLGLDYYKQLNNNQLRQIQKRNNFFNELEKKLNEYYNNTNKKNVQIGEVSKELLYVCSEYNKIVKENKYLIDQVESSINKEIVDNKLQNQLNQQLIINDYIKILVEKNLKKSFLDEDIDILNYFKIKSCIEEEKQYIPNTNLSELVDFIHKKQVRKNKKTKFPLFTSCLGCLSDHNEQANKLKSCYECGSRFHELCQQVTQTGCSICNSKKMKKVRLKQCIFCPNKGMIYKKIEKKCNAHVFCILIFNFFQIQNKQITTKIIPNCSKYLKSESECIICRSREGIVIKCTDCQKQMHPTCAYFSGYAMQYQKSSVKIKCCKYSTQQRLKNQFNRNYRSNINRFTYRFNNFENYLKFKSKFTFTFSGSSTYEQLEKEQMQYGFDDIESD